MINNKKIEWQTIVKVLIIVFILFYMWATYSAINFTKFLLKQFQNESLKQETKTKKIHDKANYEVKEITDAMINGVQDLEKKRSEFLNKRRKFKNTFAKEINNVIYERWKSHYEDITYDFINGQLFTYDKEIYDREAIKFEKLTKVIFPTFDSFIRLRDKRTYCAMLIYNLRLENSYKNKIAELKYKHQENKIAAIHKPKLLTWPLSKYEYRILDSEFLSYNNFEFQKTINLDGMCIL